MHNSLEIYRSINTLFAVTASIIAFFVAKRKGRNTALWGPICLFIPCFLLFLELLLYRNNIPITLKHCDACSHEVSTVAKSCPNCGHPINKKPLTLKSISEFIFCIILLMFVISGFIISVE